MKQSDIFTLVLIAGIGTLAAFFMCNAIMGDPDEAKVEFTRLSNVISANLAAPNPEIFNDVAINPTIEVYVGDCEDINRNGILDQEDLAACGKTDVETITAEMTIEDIEALIESDKCVLTINDAVKCGDDKLTYLTEMLQLRKDSQENEG